MSVDSPIAGIVKAIHLNTGDKVGPQDLVIEIEQQE